MPLDHIGPGVREKPGRVKSRCEADFSSSACFDEKTNRAVCGVVALTPPKPHRRFFLGKILEVCVGSFLQRCKG